MHGDLKTFLRSVRNSYSALVFSRDSWVGIALLLVTFLYPMSGLCGLLCCLLVNGLAMLLSLNRFKMVNGLYGFNAVIVGVAIGTLYPCGVSLFVMLFALSIMVLLLIAGLDGILEKYHLPYLVFPFLFCLWTVLLLTQQMDGEIVFDCVFGEHDSMLSLGGFSLSTLSDHLVWVSLPKWLTSYFLGLSCILFRQDVMVGFLLAVILLCYSRIAILYTFVSHLLAYFLYVFMGGDLFHIPYVCFGFNFILTSLALGCSYLVPSKSSFLWSLLLVPVQFIVVYASTRLLTYLYLPTFSLSFCLVSLLFLTLLKMRGTTSSPTLSYFLERTPEENLYQHRTGLNRFKWYGYQAFDLPFCGIWTVSQGPHGAYTHKDQWADAWDFVVEVEGSQFRGDGSRLEDYYCYGKPVMSPGEGVVVAIENSVDDNPVGVSNEVQNWGNYVIIKHGEELYSLLAHLKRDSFRCVVGQQVAKGEELALCGNTGLSPYPHLHFQFQSAPYAGAPTLSYPLVNYMEVGADGSRLCSCGMPGEGSSLFNLIGKNERPFGFLFAKGARFLSSSDRFGEAEWVVCEEYGYSFLYDERNDSKAWFSCKEGVFEFQRYEGDRKCALYYFFLSHFKTVVGDVENWKLTDEVPLSIRRAGFMGYLQDLVAPFCSFVENTFQADGTSAGGGMRSSVSTSVKGRVVSSLSFRTVCKPGNSLEIEVEGALKISISSSPTL